MNTLTVAPASATDVLELRQKSWVGVEPIYYDGAGVPTTARILWRAQQRLGLWVAKSDQEIVGYALARKLSSRLYHLAPVETAERDDSDSIAAALLQSVYDTSGDDIVLSATVFRDQQTRMARLSQVGFRPLDDAAMSAGLSHFVRSEIAWWEQPSPAVVMSC